MDLIERQAAIKAIDKTPLYHIENEDFYICLKRGFTPSLSLYKGEDIYKAIYGVPPVEIEPLTDEEQRIFLAAMSREHKICEQVDKEWKDSGCVGGGGELAYICGEIERKVKAALWGI